MWDPAEPQLYKAPHPNPIQHWHSGATLYPVLKLSWLEVSLGWRNIFPLHCVEPQPALWGCSDLSQLNIWCYSVAPRRYFSTQMGVGIWQTSSAILNPSGPDPLPFPPSLTRISWCLNQWAKCCNLIWQWPKFCHHSAFTFNTQCSKRKRIMDYKDNCGGERIEWLVSEML